MEGKIKFLPVGDQAVLVQMGREIDEEINRQVMALADLVKQNNPMGMVEMIPAFASLLVCYNPLETEYETMADILKYLVGKLTDTDKKGGCLVEIPVCYGGSYGEDLPFVAEHSGLSQEEVIAIHSGRDYRIYMLGFLPGFPYLGGMDQRIVTPRLSNPRAKILAGSVGIGGEQTGIYPMDSPGGWQLIGRTPYTLYDWKRGGEIPYEAGDTIRFVPITPEEFCQIQMEQKK